MVEGHAPAGLLFCSLAGDAGGTSASIRLDLREDLPPVAAWSAALSSVEGVWEQPGSWPASWEPSAVRSLQAGTTWSG